MAKNSLRSTKSVATGSRVSFRFISGKRNYFYLMACLVLNRLLWDYETILARLSEAGELIFIFQKIRS